MEKYVNTSGFDMNSFAAERVAAREAQEKSSKFYNKPNVIAAQEEKIKKEQEHAESLRRMRNADDLGFANNRDYERFIKEERLKDEKLREQERDIKYKEHYEKVAATKQAYERYKKKSIFYRRFHKSVYKMNRQNMSIDDINELYGGRTR